MSSDTKGLLNESPSPGARRSRFIFTLRVVIGLSIIGILIWRTDVTLLIQSIVRIEPFWLAMAFLTQILAKLIWALRWSILLEIFMLPVSFVRATKGVYVGLFFSNFLPTSFGGDFYRGYWVLDDKKQYPTSMFSIFSERFVGFAMLGYVALPGFIFLIWQGIEPFRVRLIMLIVLGGLCTSIFALHPAVFGFLNRVLFRQSRVLAGLRNKVSQLLKVLHDSDKGKWRVYVLSIGVHLAGILFFYCLGRGLGLALDAWQYFVIVPLVVVATLLPLSFNGLGIREGALVLLTAALGAEVYPAQAIALGLVSSIVILIVSLIGGVFYIMGAREKTYVPQQNET